MKMKNPTKSPVGMPITKPRISSKLQSLWKTFTLENFTHISKKPIPKNQSPISHYIKNLITQTEEKTINSFLIKQGSKDKINSLINLI